MNQTISTRLYHPFRKTHQSSPIFRFILKLDFSHSINMPPLTKCHGMWPIGAPRSRGLCSCWCIFRNQSVLQLRLGYWPQQGWCHPFTQPVILFYLSFSVIFSATTLCFLPSAPRCSHFSWSTTMVSHPASRYGAAGSLNSGQRTQVIYEIILLSPPTVQF